MGLKAIRSCVSRVASAALCLAFCVACGTTAALSQTDLYRDIRPRNLTFAAGLETLATGDTSVMTPDIIHESVAYAFTDWLEAKLVAHYAVFPGLGVRLDVIDIFTDGFPLSLLLQAEAGLLFNNEEGKGAYLQAGLGLNWHPLEPLEIFAGTGYDSVAEAWCFQAGGYFAPYPVLGLAFAYKLLFLESGTQFLFTIGPDLHFELGRNRNGTPEAEAAPEAPPEAGQ